MKILIIGFGSIGKRHFKVLTTLYPNSEISIVSKHSNEINVKYRNINEVKDIDIYDYYVIASETYLHYEHLKIINDAVEGKKILVEKPLFHKPLAIENIKNKIYVGYNLRFHPIIQYLKNLSFKPITISVYAGQYLPEWRPDRNYLETYSASFERGGGVLLDLSHEIDYLNYLFGSFHILSAFGRKLSNLKINTEDYVTFLGAIRNQSAINVTLEYISKIPIRRIHVNCIEGTLLADLINGVIRYKTDKMKSYEEIILNCERNYTYAEMHKNIIENNGSNACSYEEGIYVLNIVSQINKFIKRGVEKDG